jgi:pterin-4a-carbinolamine dehydratase
MTKVLVWGMDSWSGRELEKELEFKDYGEALSFVKSINSRNTSKVVPEYYRYAEIER